MFVLSIQLWNRRSTKPKKLHFDSLYYSVGGFIGALIGTCSHNMMRSGIKSSTQIENELEYARCTATVTRFTCTRKPY